MCTNPESPRATRHRCGGLGHPAAGMGVATRAASAARTGVPLGPGGGRRRLYLGSRLYCRQQKIRPSLRLRADAFRNWCAGHVRAFSGHVDTANGSGIVQRWLALPSDGRTRTVRARVVPSLWKRPARDVSPLQVHYGIYGNPMWLCSGRIRNRHQHAASLSGTAKTEDRLLSRKARVCATRDLSGPSDAAAYVQASDFLASSVATPTTRVGVQVRSRRAERAVKSSASKLVSFVCVSR